MFVVSDEHRPAGATSKRRTKGYRVFQYWVAGEAFLKSAVYEQWVPLGRIQRCHIRGVEVIVQSVLDEGFS